MEKKNSDDLIGAGNNCYPLVWPAHSLSQAAVLTYLHAWLLQPFVLETPENAYLFLKI